MRLQRKTLLITSASAVVLFSIVFTTSAAIIWNSFASLERKEIQEQTDHMQSLVQDQLDRLQAATQEWALRTARQDGLRIDEETLVSRDVNLVLQIDDRGQVALQRAVDLAGRPEARLPASLIARDWVNDPLARFDSPTERRTGVLALPEGALMVSLAPVWDAPAPRRRGALLIGKWLRGKQGSGSKLVRPQLTLQRLGPEPPDASRRALLEKVRSGPYYRVLDRDRAEGFFTLNDPLGQPIFLGAVVIPRTAAAQGRACILHMLVGLLAAGVGFALVVRRMVNKIVLSRLLRLVNDVRRFSRSSDASQLELNVKGNDELTDLATAVHELARDLCLLRDVSETANAADGKADVALQSTLDQICHVLDWPLAHVYIVEGGDSKNGFQELWNRNMHPRFAPFQDATTAMCRSSDRGLIDRVVSSRQSVWIANIQADKTCARRDVAMRVGIQAAFGFPICVGVNVVAVVEMFSLRPQSPNPGVIRIAEQIGSQIGRVFERNHISRELQRLHKQLADAAHQEGMAEVATSVLHNVGNVLNSVNVSAALIRDVIDHSEMRLYRKAMALVEEHEQDLGLFIQQDEKGKYLPKYLVAAARRLDDEFQEIETRVESLEENIDHIKTIIAMQQAYARVRGTQHCLLVTELLDDALHLYKDSFASQGVQVVRHYEPVPRIEVDRHRLMQVIHNLLKNAQESLLEANSPQDRRIVIRVASDEEGWVRIEFSDNGVGIGEENLGKIFTYGFTTKETGHGFGLHGCANSLKEMGGAIRVQSSGPGKGAAFTVKLPVVLEGVEACQI